MATSVVSRFYTVADVAALIDVSVDEIHKARHIVGVGTMLGRQVVLTEDEARKVVAEQRSWINRGGGRAAAVYSAKELSALLGVPEEVVMETARRIGARSVPTYHDPSDPGYDYQNGRTRLQVATELGLHHLDTLSGHRYRNPGDRSDLFAREDAEAVARAIAHEIAYGPFGVFAASEEVPVNGA